MPLRAFFLCRTSCPGGGLPLPGEAKPRLTGAPPARGVPCPSQTRQSLGSPGHPARGAPCPSQTRQSLGSPGHPAREAAPPRRGKASAHRGTLPGRRPAHRGTLPGGHPAPPRRGKASAHRGTPCPGGGLPLSGEAKPRLTGAPCPGGGLPLSGEAKPRLTGAPCPGGALPLSDEAKPRLTGAPCPGGALPLSDEAKPRLTGAPCPGVPCSSQTRQSLGSPGQPLARVGKNCRLGRQRLARCRAREEVDRDAGWVTPRDGKRPPTLPLDLGSHSLLRGGRSQLDRLGCI